jgi:hypothetical protein
LRRESFVVSQNERRTLRLFDHVGDRERLAAARDAEQNLILGAVVQAIDDLLYRFGLIAFWCVFRDETELHSLIIKQTRAKREMRQVIY